MSSTALAVLGAVSEAQQKWQGNMLVKKYAEAFCERRPQALPRGTRNFGARFTSVRLEDLTHAIKDELLLKGYPAMTSREILDLVLGPGKALHDEDHSYRDRMYLAPSAMHDMHPECTSLCVCMHVARWCRVACGM